MASTRREFMRSASLATGLGAVPALQVGSAQKSANDRINVAVVGLHGRGKSHYQAYSKMKDVRIVALCDVDERLFPEAIKSIEDTAGYRPETEIDIRKLVQRKDLDAVSIATPDYWHALMTIWACQAGKDVYVEKPVSFTIEEGRKMVQAARKYNRIVQAGLNRRCEPNTRSAMRMLGAGEFGKVYRSKLNIVKPRGSIGRVKEASIPEGVHWDLYLGPTKYQPFNLNRFHYGWHFYWDTSTTDIGNTGVHWLDVARWGMGQMEHPVKVHSSGGMFVWDSDQESPNVQSANWQYADGSLMAMELTNVYSPEQGPDTIFFTTKGYVLPAENDTWKTTIGTFVPRDRPEISEAGVNDHVARASSPIAKYTPGPAIADEPTVSHFRNFIDCVRSRKVEDLYCDIEQGHLSSVLAHQANISFRLGRSLEFNPKKEQFIGDDEANKHLTREYREPYVLPKEV